MSAYPFTFEDTDIMFGNCPMMKVFPPGYVLPGVAKEHLPHIYNLEVRPDDVWLLGMGKSGTTWASEMIWGVYHEVDLTEAKQRYALERWMLAETNFIMQVPTYGLDEKTKKDYYSEAKEHFTCDIIDKINNAKSPRFIRSHLPLCLLPPNLIQTCKVVYMARNFKDIWVSLFKMIEGTPGHENDKLEDTVEEYVQDKGIYAPLCEHLKEAWVKRNHKNMYFLLYEDMKKDLPGVVQKMAKYLEKDLSSEQINVLLDHLSVEKMRKNMFANNDELKQIGWLAQNQEFIRKGISGDWKNHFTAELLAKHDNWWKSHMEDCDFSFPED